MNKLINLQKIPSKHQNKITHLNKSIVTPHINTNKPAIIFKQHLKIFTPGTIYMIIHHKEGITGLNFTTSAAMILAPLDTTITLRKLGSNLFGNPINVPALV